MQAENNRLKDVLFECKQTLKKTFKLIIILWLLIFCLQLLIDSMYSYISSTLLLFLYKQTITQVLKHTNLGLNSQTKCTVASHSLYHFKPPMCLITVFQKQVSNHRFLGCFLSPYNKVCNKFSIRFRFFKKSTGPSIAV